MAGPDGGGWTGAGRVLTALATALAVVALGAAGLAQGRSSQGPARAASPQNVIVVMTDDMTTSQLRYLPQTRALLRARGVKYAEHFAVQPLCCPSRATFLTGQYPHNHGVRDNAPPLGGYEALPPDTLNRWVREAGYRTAWVGKFLNGYGKGTDPAEVPAGWDEWAVPTDPVSYYDYTLNVNGELRSFGSERRDYLTDVLARRAAALIRTSDEPLFMVVSPYAPHKDLGGLAIPAERHLGDLEGAPLPSPEAFEDDLSDKPPWVAAADGEGPRRALRRWRRGTESLLAVDDLMTGLRSALVRRHELSDTVLAFTSDNGIMYGEHGLRKKNVPYEPAISLPLLVRGPGFPRGAVDRRLTANVDLAPTITELTGADSPIAMDGRSLLGAGSRQRLLIEGGTGGASLPSWTGLRTPGASYVEYAGGDEELYDLAADPEQLINLAGDAAYAALQAGLASELAAARDCAGAACP